MLRKYLHISAFCPFPQLLMSNSAWVKEPKVFKNVPEISVYTLR